MVWPIIRGKSYVGKTGKSMKAVELAVAQTIAVQHALNFLFQL